MANAVAQRRREIGIRVAVMSSPVMHDGRIYVGCDDGAVYSVRLEEGPPPRRAVFWDEERSRWNALAGYENVRSIPTPGLRGVI